MARGFRFSFNVFSVPSGKGLQERCRRAESAGYDTVFAADHLGAPAPFPLLVAAAGETERLRVGTLVLNASFWNPALLAREVATTDILTDGRLELGLGAGHMKWEFDTAGITWPSFGSRAKALADMISELERFFSGDLAALSGGIAPQPVQRCGFAGFGPPLIVGGTGDRVLAIAARHADIIGVAGVYQVKGQPPGTFRLGTVPRPTSGCGSCAGHRTGQRRRRVAAPRPAGGSHPRPADSCWGLDQPARGGHDRRRGSRDTVPVDRDR